MISILFIILSTIALTLNTLPSLQEKVDDHVTGDNFQLTFIENICICWFTFELVIRFISSPEKSKFFKQVLNIIDLLSILPFFISLISLSDQFQDARRVIGVFKVMRILR